MARISGVNIPLNKRVEIGLTYIYGVGRSTSNKLLTELDIEPDRKVRDLTEEEVIRLREAIDSELTVEGDLRRERSQNIKTNARTRKGPKRMQVAGKKKATKK
jgi:small subunit ribosomal protein S13